MTHQSTAKLKALARGQLLSDFRTAAFASFFIVASNTVLSILGMTVIDRRSAFGLASFELFVLLKNTLLSILYVGFNLLFLKLAVARKTALQDLFWGFHNLGNKIIKLSLFLTIAESLFLFPAGLVGILLPLSEGLYLALFGLGFAGSVVFRLIYSQAFFLLLDFPKKEWRELLSMSRALMRGNLLRLTGLYISFIPMGLLCVLSLGFGVIWVLPYLHSSLANFFLDLMQRRE